MISMQRRQLLLQRRALRCVRGLLRRCRRLRLRVRLARVVRVVRVLHPRRLERQPAADLLHALVAVQQLLGHLPDVGARVRCQAEHVLQQDEVELLRDVLQVQQQQVRALLLHLWRGAEVAGGEEEAVRVHVLVQEGGVHAQHVLPRDLRGPQVDLQVQGGDGPVDGGGDGLLGELRARVVVLDEAVLCRVVLGCWDRCM
jgi:hypothetical protein